MLLPGAEVAFFPQDHAVHVIVKNHGRIVDCLDVASPTLFWSTQDFRAMLDELVAQEGLLVRQDHFSGEGETTLYRYVLMPLAIH